jgi:hypothetical protein
MIERGNNKAMCHPGHFDLLVGQDRRLERAIGLDC